jgi:hypothetical protein
MEMRRRKLAVLYKQKRTQKETVIRDYFLGLNRNEQSSEIIEIIDYFTQYKKFSFFPYKFVRKYHAGEIDVFYDDPCKMYFVLHNGKKLYFPQDWDIEDVREYYNGLCIEQDEGSPHRYETKDFIVKDGDIIADIGAAEGIWALNYTEKAGKIYLFECENHWIKALQKTFEPWKEKTVIVKKYISNKNKGGKVSLDEFFKEEPVDFIKADIEGAEVELLEGSKSLLSRSENLSLLLCAYHKKDDETKLKKILEDAGFTTEYSNGYMLFIYDEELTEPYIRHGLIRARKI